MLRLIQDFSGCDTPKARACCADVPFYAEYPDGYIHAYRRKLTVGHVVSRRDVKWRPVGKLVNCVGRNKPAKLRQVKWQRKGIPLRSLIPCLASYNAGLLVWIAHRKNNPTRRR